MDFICRSASQHAIRKQMTTRELQCISERLVECGRIEPTVAANSSGDDTGPIF